ncbi:MAG: BRO family protein [Pseudanabaenaceae cyanobacterium bins.68]|nr:BRO family protein [Pseudanabaenaceae cyanobacterium bins.68]
MIEIFGSYEDQEIRWNGDINNPLWIAQDVCKVLGLDNNREACSCIPDDDLVSVKVTSGSQKREMLAVTEAGLYRLIFKSRKPEAEEFKKWVFREVLTSIRKNGYYLGKPMTMTQLRLQAKKQQKALQLTKLMITDKEISWLEEAVGYEQEQLALPFVDELPTIEVRSHKRKRSPRITPIQTTGETA